MSQTMTQERETTEKRPADSPPERSLEQRMAALLKGNGIRLKRAQLKRDLKARKVDVVAMIVDPPDWLETARVWDLLLATPKLGRVKTSKLADKARISPSKTVGGLTRRQRVELVALIRAVAGRGDRPLG